MVSLINIEEIFAGVTQKEVSKKGHYTAEEWEEIKSTEGAKRFKNKALGFFKFSAIKTLDEMARLLYETGVVPSSEEGKKLTPKLDGKSIRYSDMPFWEELGFEKVTDRHGKEAYKIYKFSSLP